MDSRQEFSARGEDATVHLVDAPPDGLVDPSPYRARCGQPVLELYNDHRTVTCPRCTGGS